jgi:DNA-binding transcriptional ArsR family regulator
MMPLVVNSLVLQSRERGSSMLVAKPPPCKALPLELAEAIAGRFSVLGETTRVRLLDCLIENDESSVQELSDLLELPHANVSKHLNVLHRERIVGRRKVRTKVFYFLADETILGVRQLVCGGIRDQLRELGELTKSSGARAFGEELSRT